MLEKEFQTVFEIEEKRCEIRVGEDAPLFIETISDDPFSNESTREIIECRVVDVSANGFQIQTNRELTVGAIHSVMVNMNQDKAHYTLVAEVRWMRNSGEGYRAGLMLFDSDGSEIIAWKQSMVGRLG